MDGWDNSCDSIDMTDSLDLNDEMVGPSDVDVESTMDSVELPEENLEFQSSDVSIDIGSNVDDIMGAVEVPEVEFAEENNSDISSETLLEQSGTEETFLENITEESYDSAIENPEDIDAKILTRDQTEQWQVGSQAIENTLDAMRDDLRDKGIEDGAEMEALIAQERSDLQEELARNIEGDLSYHSDGPSWQSNPDLLEGIETFEDQDSPAEIGSFIDEDPNSEPSDSHATEFEEFTENEESSIDSPIEQQRPEEIIESEELISDETQIEHSPEIEETFEMQEISGRDEAEETEPENTLDVMNNVETDEVQFEGEAIGIENISADADQAEYDQAIDQLDIITENSEELLEVSEEVKEIDPQEALSNLSDYMNSHNYGLEDYATYSKDPEWQALNRDLQIANGIEVNESIAENLPETSCAERVFDEFEQSVLDKDPDFYETGSFYSQGINSRGFEGTCGPTSQANAINKLFDSNELTENKVLDIAVENNLCNLDGPASSCGGTTTDQFMELYSKVNEQLGDKFNTELYEYDNVLDAAQVADRLEAGDVVNVAVDSATLWGQPHGIADLLGVRKNVISDHWITVTGVNRSETGDIEGFDIIDSGGGENYVTLDKYNDMCFGSGSRKVADPTCIVLSKKC